MRFATAGLSVENLFYRTGPASELDAESMELIESGTISSPVEYLDIDLPSGYDLFKAFLCQAMGDGNNRPTFALSDDGGVTFYADDANFDSYRTERFSEFAGSPSVDSFDDSLGYLSNRGPANTAAITIEMTIAPGGTGLNAIVHWGTFFYGASNARAEYGTVQLLDATGRINAIRLLPSYGNGDANPPTIGQHFTAGSYFLYGIPTP